MPVIGTALTCVALLPGAHARVPYAFAEVSVSGTATQQLPSVDGRGWAFYSRRTHKLVATWNTRTRRITSTDLKRTHTVCAESN